MVKSKLKYLEPYLSNKVQYIHNPAHIIGMQKVTFRVPVGRLGMWQIVGMLHVGLRMVWVLFFFF